MLKLYKIKKIKRETMQINKKKSLKRNQKISKKTLKWMEIKRMRGMELQAEMQLEAMEVAPRLCDDLPSHNNK